MHVTGNTMKCKNFARVLTEKASYETSTNVVLIVEMVTLLNNTDVKFDFNSVI